ncbi:hypothetical protein C8F01DRAFT_1231836, partial [Mycena amicta]
MAPKQKAKPSTSKTAPIDWERRAKEAEAALRALEKKAQKPKLIPRPPRNSSGRELSVVEMRDAMQLAGTENDSLYNRLVTLIQYSFCAHIPVTGTWSTFKKRQGPIVETIAK